MFCFLLRQRQGTLQVLTDCWSISLVRHQSHFSPSISLFIYISVSQSIPSTQRTCLLASRYQAQGQFLGEPQVTLIHLYHHHHHHGFYSGRIRRRIGDCSSLICRLGSTRFCECTHCQSRSRHHYEIPCYESTGHFDRTIFRAVRDERKAKIYI